MRSSSRSGRRRPKRARTNGRKNLRRVSFCPQCNRSYFSHGVSPMLTVKCPNCGQLMGIKELFVGGRNLIYSGLRMLDNCASLIGDNQEYGHGDEEDLHTMNELNMLKRIVRTLLKEMPNEVDIGDLDERSREWIRKEREQDSYFERNPNSTLGKGNVHGQM